MTHPDDIPANSAAPDRPGNVLTDRFANDLRFRNTVRCVIGSVAVHPSEDNLGILLASELESHPDCPEDGDLDDSGAWKQWSVDRAYAAMDAIAMAVFGLPSIAISAADAAEIERLTRELAETKRVLARYRKETPLGHQPHMIAHEADAALAAREEAQK